MICRKFRFVNERKRRNRGTIHSSTYLFDTGLEYIFFFVFFFSKKKEDLYITFNPNGHL